jgi:hypothetical protein
MTLDLHDRFARGERAQALLADPTYLAVTRALKEGYTAAMFSTKPGNAERRDEIYYQYQALDDIASELAGWVEDGLDAKAELDDQAAESIPYDPLDYYEAD